MPAENLSLARRAIARGVGARWSVLFLAATLGACAQKATAPDAPQLEMFPQATQRQVGALKHWDVVADDVATRLALRLRDWPQGEHPIYLEPSAPGTFSQAFHALLLTRLLDKGLTISKVPTEVSLQVEVQVVHHGLRQVPQALAGLPAHRLHAGVQVRRGLESAQVDALAVGNQSAGERAPSETVLHEAQPRPVVLRSVALGAPPVVISPVAPAPLTLAQSEVLISTSLEQSDRYLTRTADLYYVELDNAALFEPPPPPPPAPVPTPVKRWQVGAP